MSSRRVIALLLVGSCLVPWRVLRTTLRLRRLRTENPQLFDGPAALAAILAALEQDGYTHDTSLPAS